MAAKQEQTTGPSIGEQVISLLEAAQTTLRDLDSREAAFEPVLVGAEEDYGEELGEFILAHMGDVEEVFTEKKPSSLVRSSKALHEARERRDLLDKYREVYLKRRGEEVGELLQDRLVTARSTNGLGFSISDGAGYHLGGPDSPLEVTGTFWDSDAETGTIMLCTAKVEIYVIQLLQYGEGEDSFEAGRLPGGVTLEVHE
jgi:hypothetical protein